MAENFEGTDDFIGFEAGRSAPPRPSAPAAPSSGGGGSSIDQFRRQYGGAAERAGSALGVDPSLILAQWGLETGWGRSVIPGTNNLGNIKAIGGWQGPSVRAHDRAEGSNDPYRAYKSADDFADDYVRLISGDKRYRETAPGSGSDMRQFASALKSGGYATDPNYVSKMEGALRMLGVESVPGSRREIPAGPGDVRQARPGEARMVRQAEREAEIEDDLDFTSLQGREIGHYGQMAPAQAKGAGKATERTAMQAFVTDPAAALTAGAGGTIKGFGTLWGLAGGDFDNAATRAGEAVREIGEGMKSPGLKARENIRREMIDAQDGEIRKFLTAINATITDPGLFASTLTEQIPNLLPGMAIGRAARVAGAAAGMTGAGAGGLGVGAAVGTGGAMQGADAAGDAFEQIMKADKAEWERNPEFRQMVDEQKIDPDIARRTLALSAVRQAFLTSGGASIALSQLPGARSIDRMLVGAKGGAGGMVRGAATGFVGEGFTEGGDEAIGKIAGNQAVRGTVDPSRPLMEGTGEAAAMGALFAPVGGVAGAVSGRRGDPAQVSDVIPNAPGGTPEGSLNIDDILGPQPDSPSSPAAPRPEQVAGTMGQLMPMPAPQPQAPPAPTEEDFTGRLREIAERQAGLEEQIGAARGTDAAEGDRLRATDARKEWRALEDERRQIVDQLGGEEAAQEALRRAGRGFDAAPDAMPTADGFDAVGGREPGMGPRRAPGMDSVGGATIDAATGRPIEALPRPAGMPATQEPIRVEPIDQAGGQPPVEELGGNFPPRSPRAAQVAEELRRLGVSSPAAKRGEVSEMPPYPGEDRPVTRQDRILEELDAIPSKPLADPRLGNPAVRAELELMAGEAGWAQRGGYLLRDNDAKGLGGTGKVTGRTEWVPKAAWFGAMKERLDEKGTREAVRKALAGEKLGAKEARVIGQMLTHAEAYARMWDAAQDEYNSLSPAEQAFVDQTMENTLEAIGRDQVEAIAERVAIETQGESVYTHATRLVSALQGAAYEEEQRRRAEDEPATPGGIEGTRPQDARAPPDAARDEPVREERQEGFDLVGQTPDDLRRLDQEQRLAADEERQTRERENAPPPEDFALTGSDRPADVGAAAGQQGLFEQPSLGLNAPSVDQAAHQAATSPANALPEPTESQKKAGNYAKGHVTIAGLDISIENPAGTKRRPEWPAMPAHYGYFRQSEAKDGDQVDVYVEPGTPNDFAGKVWVVDQMDERGIYDEPKVMLGFASEEAARHAYTSAFTPGAARAGAVTEMDIPTLKRWLAAAEPSLMASTWMKRQQPAAIEAATPASEPEQQVAPAPKPTRKQKVAQEAAAATKSKKPRAQKVKEEAEAIEKQKAQEDFDAALADIADIFGKNIRAAITPEQEVRLLPALTRLFDAAFRIGKIKFKEAARHVLDTFRAKLGDDVADQISIDHLSGAYIAMSGKYRDRGADSRRDVIAVESIEDLAEQPAAEPEYDGAATQEAATNARDDSGARSGTSGDRPAGGDARTDRGDDPRAVEPGVAEAGQGAGEGRGPGGRAAGAGGRGAGSARADERPGKQPPDRSREEADLRDQRGAPAPVAANSNYVITDEINLGSGTERKKYRDNIEAIRTLKAIEAEGRRASVAEQATLARYVGWGSMKGPFNPDAEAWAAQYTELRDLLTPEEYAAARRSTLDAHYTSVPVVRAIHGAMSRMGFKGGRVLEPAMGTGNFLGLMPKTMLANSKIVGVEQDSLTGRIAKQLYPKANILAPLGFQDAEIPKGYFDVAIGNPPFGDQQLYDSNNRDISKFSIHNFFFAKSMESLRPGGILAMVTSHYFLDTIDQQARNWIGDRANMIGAVRLPNSAFKATAGTEVVTDIVFFQKLGDGITASPREWEKSSRITIDGTEVRRSGYYDDHPEMILGRETLGGSMYSANEYTVEANGLLAVQLETALERLPTDIYSEPEKRIEILTDVDGIIPADLYVDGLFVMKDGAIGRRLADVMGDRRFERMDVKETTAKRVQAIVPVRDALTNLMRAELADDSGIKLANLRDALNKAYDDFQKKWGYLNQLVNRRAFAEDAKAPLVLALETDFDPGISPDVAKKRGVQPRAASAGKAAIFTKRVLAPWRPATRADSPKDALVASLNERGKVDVEYMAGLLRTDQQAVIDGLGDAVFEKPDGGWETADAYLGGNVKAKLAAARAALKDNPKLQRNVDALQKVIPADVLAEQISVRIGSPFVKASFYEDFTAQVFDSRARVTYVKAAGRYMINWHSNGTAPFVATYGTPEMPANKIMESLLGMQPVVVKKNIGTRDEPRWVVDEEETAAAQAKADELQSKFRDWAWTDDARRAAIERDYNDNYNTDAPRRFDGSHMTFPGMSPLVSLRKHQKDAIWRALQERRLLADHVVGAGKTWALAAMAIEGRRLGFMRKPMFAVPNHLVVQWRDDFYRLYPNANVLAAMPKDFEKANRQRLFARIATGDWDAVIVGHSSFGKVGMPKEALNSILNEQIVDITSAIEAQKRERGDRRIVAQMEKMKEKLEARLKKAFEKSGKKDRVVDFAELGVDGLFVDEAHEFKNLFYTSAMTNVSGLGDREGSGKALDMFVKMQHVQRMGGFAIMATGTPVSNSLVEMFTMQRFMIYEDMKARGLETFDAWANVFGEPKAVYEVATSGVGYQLRERMAKFTNVPELAQLYGSFADVVLQRDLRKQAADAGQRWPIPNAKGGRPAVVVAKRSPEQDRFFGVPELRRDEKGRIIFKGDADKMFVGPTAEGKFAVFTDVGAKEPAKIAGPYDDEQDAKDEMRGLATTPIVGFPEGSLLWKFENLRQLMKDSDGKINALSLTNEARKAALDMRLVNPSAPDFADSKVNQAANNVLNVWKEWGADRGTQLVFLDLSTPASARKKIKAKAEQNPETVEEDEGEEASAAPEDAISMDELIGAQSSFSVYDNLREKLIERGIPAEQIAFIHDYDTPEKKGKLFAAVNSGQIRVLMGSTPKMGAGMNVQERIVAVHHLDAPWRPSDLEQRNGRMYRQGNKLYLRDPDGFQVQEYRYATDRTYDSRIWQLLEHKARAVEQLRNADGGTRELEDIAGEAANASEMKAAASGNPLIQREIELRNTVQKLDAGERAHRQARVTNLRNAQFKEGAQERFQKQLDELGVLQAAVRGKRDPFVMEVDGRPLSEKKEAADAILAKVAELGKVAAGADVAVGKYRGMTIEITKTANSVEAYLTVGDVSSHFATYGSGDHFSAAGFITRVENAVENFGSSIERIQATIKREKADGAELRKQADAPYTKAEELQAARLEHRQVLTKLQAQGGGVELPPVAAEELKLAQAEVLKRMGRPAQRRGAEPGRISVQDARNYIATLRQSWRNAPRVNVVETADQLPFSHDPDAMGAFFKGQVWIVAGAHESLAEVQYTLFHETIGHYGLRGMFAPGLGDAMARGATEMEGDGITEDTAAEILRGLEKMDLAMAEIAAKNANIRAEAARWRQRNPKGDMSAHAWEMLSIEEAMSNLAGEGRPFTGMKRFLAAAQRLLRAIGLDAVADWMERASDAEALAILADSHAFVQRGQRAHVYGPELAAKFSRRESVDGDALNEDIAKLRSGKEAADWLFKNSKNLSYRAIARRIAPFVSGARIVIVSNGVSVPGGVPLALNGAHGVYFRKDEKDPGTIYLKDATFSDHGLSETTLLHELIHAATVARIQAGNLVVNQKTELSAAVMELMSLRDFIVDEMNRRFRGGRRSPFEESLVAQIASRDVRELVTYGLTDPRMQDLLRGMQMGKRSGWSAFVDAVRRILGIGREDSNALAALLDVTDRILSSGVDGVVTPFGEQLVARVGNRGGPAFSRRADRTAEDLLSKPVGRGPLEAVTKGVTQALKIDKATKWAFDRLTTLIGDRIPESVKAGMVDKYGLTDQHKNKRAGMFASIRSGYRTGQRFVESLSGITLAESRIMYEWMTEPESRTAELEAQLKPEALERLRGMREFIDSIGAEAVRLGDMSAEVFERNKGAWLHRSYMKHEAEETASEKAHRARTVKILGDQYKMRGIKHETALDTILSVLPKEWGARVKRQGVEIAFKGKKFIRFERYQHRGEGTATLDGMPDPAGRGKLLEVAYWPEGETVPAKFGDWYREEVWEARWTKGDKVVMHRDFTKPEQDKMGRIAEVRFAVARSLQKMIHDVEVSKFFEWVANTEAKPEGALPAGAKVVEAREQLWRSFGKDEWVKVPEGKVPGTDVRRFGKLAGLYVPGPVWNDVRQVRNPKFGPEWFNAIMRAWKLSKTALSPAVHMNNVMANFVMADWRDLTAKDVHDALRVMMEPDSPAHKETIERFEDNGGTQGMYVLSEIQREQLKPLLDELRGTITGENNVGELARLAQIAALIGQGQLRDAWDKAGHSAPAKAAKFAGRSLMDAYEKEDTVFRLAAFIRAKREGKTDAEAGAISRESFLDYDINAPWVQMARGTLFPFIAFTYRAAPMLAKVAAEKPWKLLKLGLVAGAINAFGYLASGGDEDDERAMLPKEKEGRVWGFLVPKLLRMGWNDGDNPVFLDIRRFIPVGDIIDTGQGHAALPVPPPMIPGGPLALLFELVLNKVGFTGKPITQETDTAGEKAEKVAGFVWKAFMPNLAGVPGVPATDKIWKAGTGQTGAFGQELSTASALASAVGVKIEGYPADVAMMRMKIEMNANRREIEGNVRKMVRQEQAGAMSDEDMRAKVAREYEKLNELNAEIARKLRATQDAQARREAR